MYMFRAIFRFTQSSDFFHLTTNYIKKILYEIQQNLESVHLQNGVKILVKNFSFLKNIF